MLDAGRRHLDVKVSEKGAKETRLQTNGLRQGRHAPTMHVPRVVLLKRLGIRDGLTVTRTFHNSYKISTSAWNLRQCRPFTSPFLFKIPLCSCSVYSTQISVALPLPCALSSPSSSIPNPRTLLLIPASLCPPPPTTTSIHLRLPSSPSTVQACFRRPAPFLFSPLSPAPSPP